MLRNTLRGLIDAEALQGLGVDPQARAEELSVDEFASIAAALGPSDAV